MDYKWFESDIRPNYNIYVRHDVDSLSFTMMTKPASEGGKGCQATDLIEVAAHMISKLNEKFGCHENQQTLHNLRLALAFQKKRTANRVKRGVEGKDQA